MTQDHRKPEVAAVQEVLLDEANFLRPSSPGAQRGSQGALAMACEPLRRQAPGVHRGERVSHLHYSLEGQSTYSAAPAPGS